MKPASRKRWAWWVVVVLASGAMANPQVASGQQTSLATTKYQGAMIRPEDATNQRLTKLASKGFSVILLPAPETAQEVSDEFRDAANRVAENELQLYYWVEVARSPALAERHPQWMASLQGHPEWRRFFSETPQPAADEVVKTYPWVPILSRETHAAQLERVSDLLRALPESQGVFLNDLQGSPSACGCGNTLCRWTSDYGKRRSTQPLGDDAAATFLTETRQRFPALDVIPVWTTECEKQDGAHDGPCAGVGCFEGICWRSYTAQLEPVAKASARMGVLLPVRDFERELEVYGPPMGWIRFALKSFDEMPRKQGRDPVPARKLIAILQGWDMSPEEVETQIEMTKSTGAGGYVVAYDKIEQSWEPKIVKFRE